MSQVGTIAPPLTTGAWTNKDRRLYQRHRWRSEGFHGEAKTWHGLARAVRRGLANMKIQAYLTAAAVNLKRLAVALFALLQPWIARRSPLSIHGSRHSADFDVWTQRDPEAA
jgi:DDE family transposase